MAGAIGASSTEEIDEEVGVDEEQIALLQDEEIDEENPKIEEVVPKEEQKTNDNIQEDKKEMADRVVKLVQEGIITRNEGRLMMNEEPDTKNLEISDKLILSNKYLPKVEKANGTN